MGVHVVAKPDGIQFRSRFDEPALVKQIQSLESKSYRESVNAVAIHLYLKTRIQECHQTFTRNLPGAVDVSQSLISEADKMNASIRGGKDGE